AALDRRGPAAALPPRRRRHDGRHAGPVPGGVLRHPPPPPRRGVVAMMSRHARHRRSLRPWLAVAALALATACSAADDPRVETWVEGLRQPYSIAFLPGGDLLVTEKSGALRLVRGGRLLAEPAAVMADIHTASQGGLTDVVLHPDFAANRLVYLAYSGGNARANGTRVARGELVGDRLVNLTEIFRARPDKDTG